jgi:transforming growth factor-beta-induced protein
MRKSLFLVVVIALLGVLAIPAFAQDELPTIADIVVSSTEADPAEFTILLAAVSAADPAILEALANPEASLTVFAPTDAAFGAAIEALGMTAEDVLANTELLNTVLAYHVVPGVFAAEGLLAATADGATTVYGTLLANQGLALMQMEESLMVNEATVVAADVQAANGVVHVIDSVLLPNMDMMEMPMEEMEAPESNIGEIVIASAGGDAPEFTILLAAVQAADPAILTALTEGGPFTVFAPTDAAFAAALEALGVTAEDLLADTALLTSVLSYHVVPGAWDAASVVAAAGEEGVSVGTLLPGTTVTITVDGESVLVNDATVVATDVLATNGIVHVIDAVLLPPM